MTGPFKPRIRETMPLKFSAVHGQEEIFEYTEEPTALSTLSPFPKGYKSASSSSSWFVKWFSMTMRGCSYHYQDTLLVARDMQDWVVYEHGFRYAQLSPPSGQKSSLAACRLGSGLLEKGKKKRNKSITFEVLTLSFISSILRPGKHRIPV